MVWRTYYTLRDAAAELSREFKDTYTIADLVHYGAVGIAEFCLYDKTVKYPFIEIDEGLSEIITFCLPNDNSTIGIAPVVGGLFIPLSDWDMTKLEAHDEAEISEVYLLKGDDGKVIKARDGFIYQVIPPDVIERMKRLTFHADTPLKEFYNYAIRFTKEDLYILESDLIELKARLKEKITGKAAKNADDRRTLLNIISALKTTLVDKQVFSNQAEIIAYLANEFDLHGLSESNLKAKFAEANKQEKSN